MPFSYSATCLRNRVNSVRLTGVNGSSFRATAASTRRRSSATHHPNKASSIPALSSSVSGLHYSIEAPETWSATFATKY